MWHSTFKNALKSLQFANFTSYIFRTSLQHFIAKLCSLLTSNQLSLLRHKIRLTCKQFISCMRFILNIIADDTKIAQVKWPNLQSRGSIIYHIRQRVTVTVKSL